MFQTVAQGKSVGSWKTKMREGSGRSISDPSAVMFAGRRLLEARDEPQQSRFAATGGAEQSDELPGRDRKIDRFEYRQARAGEIKGMADAANADSDALRRVRARRL